MSSPEQPQWADIKEPKKVETSGFEIAHTPDLDKAVEKADEIAKAIQEDKPVTFGQFLEMKEALEKAIESDPRIEAKKLFGEGYFGPDEMEVHFTVQDKNGKVEKLFEYTPKQKKEINRMLREKLNDPQIKDLIRRTPKEELRQKFQLFLFPDKFKDGTPVTMKALYERFQPEMERRGVGKLLFVQNWYQSEDFFKSDSNPLSWKLLSKGNIEGSQERNYVEETRFFREYLRQNNLATVEELAECSDAKLTELTQLMITDWEDDARQLAELKINKNYRIKPLEVIFIHATRKSVLTNVYARTVRRSSDGDLLGAGLCGADGADVSGWRPDVAGRIVGVSFSR